VDADIIIVGGSIAGNYLASLLAKQGIRALVLEEHPEERIGEPVHCTGIISQKITRLVNFPSDIILNRVKEAAIYSPSGKHIIVGSPRESPVVIDRARFDRYFYEEAVAGGARYVTGIRVRDVKTGPWGVKLFSNRGTFEGNIVVGADGPMSVVARHFGVRHNFIYGVQARVRMDYPNNRTDLHFNPYWRDFFAWIVPEGNGICRVGLAAKSQPRLCFQYFLRQQGISRPQFVNTHGGLIPIGFPGSQAFSRAILLGDAACQVKATTGGGIVMLISAAQIAANALMKAIEREQYSRAHFMNEYQIPCEESIGRELKVHYLLHSLLRRFKQSDWEKIFKLYNATDMRNVFSIYGDMDFPKNFLFKLLGNPHIFSLLLNLLGKNLPVLRDIMKIWKR